MRMARIPAKWLPMPLLIIAAAIGVRGDDGSWRRSKGAIRALAPVEIVASGVGRPSAVAVESDGSILVADREKGILTRFPVLGRPFVVLDGLHEPDAMAVAPDGAVLILDDGGARVVRFADGTRETVATLTGRARAIAVTPDGSIWLAMRDAVGRRGEEDSLGGTEYVIARLDEAGAVTQVASGFLEIDAIVAGAGVIYVAMAGVRGERGPLRTRLARIPIRQDGTAAALEPLDRGARHRVSALVIDSAGDLFMSRRLRRGLGKAAGGGEAVILKRQPDGSVASFASDLRDPLALAFSPAGDLVAVEGHRPARLLRFRAPDPPQLMLPPFANSASIALDGRTGPGALIRVSRLRPEPALFDATVADDEGTFALHVPLVRNTANVFGAAATGAAGAGLVGSSALVDIVHDDLPPRLSILQPVPDAHVRADIQSLAHADDESSGVAALLWALDGEEPIRLDNPSPDQPFSAQAVVPTVAATEGPRALHVTALDAAGNRTARSTLVVVDRRPPETFIVGGPPDAIASRAVTFTMLGADDWTSVEALQYAWRLDERPWSDFRPTATVELTGLTPGVRRFEVKARDRAGNEDPTPVERTFTVTALQVRIVEPAAGAVIATESVWIRGTVDSGAREASVVVRLPAEASSDLPLTTFHASVEAGTFAVEVPLTPEVGSLTVTATDADGAIARDETSLVVVPPVGSLAAGFEASPGAGLAPQAIGFSAPAGATAFELDLESDGTSEYAGVALADQTFIYTRPGIYVATLRAATVDGSSSVHRAVVEVYDRATLEGRLQATWNGFKEALRSADVAAAATFIHSDRRTRWLEYLRQVPPNLLAEPNVAFTDLTLLEVIPGGAECEMFRDVDGLLYSFPVWFLADRDGRWRLWQF